MTVMAMSPAERVRAGWRSAHDAVDGVPRWARIAALAVPFTVLPAGLWRIAAFTLHLPIIDGDDLGPGTGRATCRAGCPWRRTSWCCRWCRSWSPSPPWG